MIPIDVELISLMAHSTMTNHVRASIDYSLTVHEETSTKVALILDRLDSMEQSRTAQERESLPSASAAADAAIDAGAHRAHDIVSERVHNNSRDISEWTVNQEPKIQCMQWCSCRCHSRTSVQSPWIIRTIFGLSSIEYKSGTTPCNDRACRHSEITQIGLTFRLPRYLLGRYIAVALSYSSLQGPILSLQVPRTMPWSHDLWKYANSGDLTAIRTMFLEGRASPHDVNPRGASALLYAAPHPKMAQLLAQHGADLSLKDDRGRTAVNLYGAILLSGKLTSEDSHIIKSILDGTDYEETRNFTTLHKIVLGLSHKDLDMELADSLVNLDAVDSNGQTPLVWAVIRDDLVTASKLLNSGASPNARDFSGSTALHYVQSVQMCKLLLTYRADVHNKNTHYARGPLHSICKRMDCVELIEMIVDAGVDFDDTDADNETPLMNAIFRCATSIARYLIDKGASLNAFNSSSRDRPIHFATTFNHHEILKYLIQRGTDYTVTNIHGRNIAHMAARYSDAKTMSILADADLPQLDVTLKDREDKTPADYLAERDILSEPENGIHQHSWKLLHSRSSAPCSRMEGIAPLQCYYVPGSFPHVFQR